MNQFVEHFVVDCPYIHKCQDMGRTSLAIPSILCRVKWKNYHSLQETAAGEVHASLRTEFGGAAICHASVSIGRSLPRQLCRREPRSPHQLPFLLPLKTSYNGFLVSGSRRIWVLFLLQSMNTLFCFSSRTFFFNFLVRVSGGTLRTVVYNSWLVVVRFIFFLSFQIFWMS